MTSMIVITALATAASLYLQVVYSCYATLYQESSKLKEAASSVLLSSSTVLFKAMLPIYLR